MENKFVLCIVNAHQTGEMIMLSQRSALQLIATNKLDVPQMLDVLEQSGGDNDVAQAFVGQISWNTLGTAKMLDVLKQSGGNWCIAQAVVATGKLSITQMLDVLEQSGGDNDVAQAVVAQLSKK